MSDLYSDFINHCGQLLNAGRLSEAEELLDGYLANNPDDAIALYLLGSAHIHKQNYGQGLMLLSQSVEIDPQLDFAWHNLGIAYRNVERYDDAIKAYAKCLQISPERADTMAMMAGAYVNIGNPKPGIEWAEKALEVAPDDPHAHNHMALLCLEDGQIERGWTHYERRWEIPERAAKARDYGGVPKWDGKKTGRLVIHGEQGLGDEILFLSCLPQEPLWDELVIEAAPRLVPLMRRSFACEVYGTHEEVMRHKKPDAWLPMGDLPRLFSIPQRRKFLKPCPERAKYWRSRLEAMGDGPYIGVAWEGGTKKTHSSLRNPPLHLFKQAVKGRNCVSLQYTQAAAQESEILGIPHWPEAIADLDEQAALIAACDHVVTICQTAVHMAGGLGTPATCLVPKAAAWRYTAPGETMIWYPAVTMIRQEEHGKWEPVFTKLEKRLADLSRVYRPEQAVA